MSERRPPKTHHTAVVAIPPDALWAPIQAIRQRYDRQIARWMPHVTLLYPFHPADHFDEDAAALAPACAALSPFDVTLAGPRFFEHGRGRYTMWLAPEPAGALVALHGALLSRVPDCDDTARLGHGFTPHLSVGQAAGRPQLDERLAMIAGAWRPMLWRVDHVALIRRGDRTPFEVARRIPLGAE